MGSLLLDLPSEVLSNLLYFLPQQLLLNLALTNFHFYEPCLRKLYKTLVIRVDPVLKSEKKASERQRTDFVQLSATVIAGFKSVDVARKGHLKLVEARLNILINSITVNPQLAQYIETIEVADAFGGEIETILGQLFDLLASVPNGITKIYIADKKLRASLGYSKFKFQFALTSVCVDDLREIGLLGSFRLKELIVSNVGKCSVLKPADIALLTDLETLLVRSDPAVYDVFNGALLKVYQEEPFLFKKLKTFTVVHSHETSSHGFPYVDFPSLENFQISLGCNNPVCGQECLETSLARFRFAKLKRLAVIQNSSPELNSHKNTEQWDLIVFELVKSIVDASDSLFYLSIRHNVPMDGLIEDGYEGNYLRKVKLYTNLLPNLLAKVQRHVVNLVLPNLLASLSCYEQPMNTLLWNGCKCPHCDKYLLKVDDYLLHHRYYSLEKHVFKDMLTVQIVRTMSEVLSERVWYDPNLGDLFQLARPKRNVTWNFHNSKFSIPFRCLLVKTYEMADFEDDKAESSEAGEQFFDAEQNENDCPFLCTEKFVPSYLILLSHFLDDIIRKMINLNRGDAEDVHIGGVNDENDGFTNLRINKMLINGIDYNFDHEINGTIFFTNLYDDLEDHYS